MKISETLLLARLLLRRQFQNRGIHATSLLNFDCVFWINELTFSRSARHWPSSAVIANLRGCHLVRTIRGTLRGGNCANIVWRGWGRGCGGLLWKSDDDASQAVARTSDNDLNNIMPDTGRDSEWEPRFTSSNIFPRRSAPRNRKIKVHGEKIAEGGKRIDSQRQEIRDNRKWI